MDTELRQERSEEDTASVDEPGREGGNSDPAISVTDLSKTYGSGDDAVTAVDGVSFEIEPGTTIGILGPNGAGKTTVIKSILSLIVPTEGTVRVNGTDVYVNSRESFRHVGAMLEGARNTYWRLTVRENLEIFTVIGGNDYRKRGEHIDALLSQFGLEAKADTVVRELSRGQKQRVSLACTMARDADVLFLDEPTLGLDVESSVDLRRELSRLVEEGGSTVVLSSHDMDVIQDVCDRVIIMNDGEIVVNDTVDSLLDVFETQAYEVTVEGQIDDQFRATLRREFDATDFQSVTDGTTFRATVVDDEFYELVDYLRDAGLSVESFDSVEANLEEIFLDVTGSQRLDDGSAR